MGVPFFIFSEIINLNIINLNLYNHRLNNLENNKVAWKLSGKLCQGDCNSRIRAQVDAMRYVHCRHLHRKPSHRVLVGIGQKIFFICWLRYKIPWVGKRQWLVIAEKGSEWKFQFPILFNKLFLNIRWDIFQLCWAFNTPNQTH